MISFLDITIILVYLLFILLIGYFSGKDNKDQADYFLASRSMPWVPIALSVAATMISANSFIGGPGWAYNEGMYPFMINITVPLAIFVALNITVPIMYNLRITSVYEYMGLRLGSYSRMLTIIQFMINSLIQVSSMVYIPVLILHTITGISIYILTPVVVGVSIIYTLIGGIKAVIWTDALQFFIVILSVFLIIFQILHDSNLNFFYILSTAKENGALDTLNFSFDLSKTNTFWATLIGGSAMWIRYFCFDQVQVQRLLTSKSIKSIKKSFVTSAFAMNIVYYFMLLIGVMLTFYYSGKKFDTSNQIMVDFILNEIPSGATGIILSGIFAAAMSSVDSILNSMTTVFTKDIYDNYFNEKKESSLRESMVITFFIGIAINIFIFIGFNGTAKSILDIVGGYLSYFSGPALGAFVLAMFTYSANDKGVFWGTILGFIFTFIISKILKLSWLWNPFIGAVVTIILGILISKILKNKSDASLKTCYNVFEIKKSILKEKSSDKHNKPFDLGIEEIIVLSFFFLQYIVFYLIQY